MNIFKKLISIRKKTEHRPSWTYSNPSIARVEFDFEIRGAYGESVKKTAEEYLKEMDKAYESLKESNNKIYDSHDTESRSTKPYSPNFNPIPSKPLIGETYDEYISRDPRGGYHDWVMENGTDEEIGMYGAYMKGH